MFPRARSRPFKRTKVTLAEHARLPRPWVCTNILNINRRDRTSRNLKYFNRWLAAYLMEADILISMEKLLTISEVCRISGILPRALRHYGEIGLLHSSTRNSVGIRCYSIDELERLHRIMILRELRVPLEKSPTFLTKSLTILIF